MKKVKFSYAIISIIIFMIICVSWAVTGLTQNNNSNNLIFKGKTNKDVYILGEPVSVKFEITNFGDTPMKIAGGGVSVGSLRVFIANSDNNYKSHVRSSWGRKQGGIKILEPGQSHTYQEIEILWNGKAKVSHLSKQAAERVLKDKITTEYAFQEPGVYFIKGITYFGEDAKPIESDPIQIVINEPTGTDLEVWNQIKGNKQIAYLMQDGTFSVGKMEEKEQLSNQVEQIIEKYPNSLYTSYLKPNLKNFWEKEAKRNEFYKDMRKDQKP